MSPLTALHFALLLALGALTTWTDLRERRIQNAHLAAFGAAFIVVSAVQGFSAMPAFWLNLGLAVAVTSLFWLRRLVPAADAKLLMAYALGTPLAAYPPSAGTVFPFALVPFLAFLASALWVLPRTLGAPLPLERIRAAALARLPGAAALFSAMFALLLGLRALAGFSPGPLASFALYVIAGLALHRLVPRVTPLAALAAVLAAEAYSLYAGAGRAFLAQLALFPAMLIVLREGAAALAARSFVHAVPVSRLQEGMVIPGVIVRHGSGQVWREQARPGERIAFLCPPEGIGSEGLRRLRRSGLREVPVAEEIAFAPFALAAALAVIALGTLA